MEWLRNNSFIAASRQTNRALLGPEEEYDPTACYDSFRKHWQQIHKIIQRAQQLPSRDDVLEVVRNLEKMVSLLIYDVKKIDNLTLPITTPSKCLEYLLGENVLDKLLEWGNKIGRYKNVIRQELLKLYEILVSQSRYLLLVHEPFLRPMLKLLSSCQGEMFEKDMEKKLVMLLYQLCVLLMQNIDLIDLFFITEPEKTKFILFELLIPYIHRDDSIGMQARDSLLLCMNLTKKNKNIANYIAKHSNICILLATGLSGLYSILSHVLTDICVPDWHRLTPDDVNDMKELSSFVTSLEFSNAVAQIAHHTISKQLQEFFYQGFLIPVLGPALLQTTVEEQIAATAYLELIIRTVTHPGLLYSVVKYLLTVEYDGQRLLNILMQRINGDSQMSLVSLALFDTLVNLNCEDIMLELVFKYLEPCLHLMVSQRRMMLPLDPHCQSFEIFLALAPSCCEIPLGPFSSENRALNWNHYGGQSSLYGNYHAYLSDARNRIGACQFACSLWTNNYTCMEVSDNIDDTTSINLSEDSSGYISLKSKLDDSDENGDANTPLWHQSEAKLNLKPSQSLNGQIKPETEDIKSSSTAGPFLTILMEKVNNMLNNTIYVNLHLTGLISRLAVYSQPLLRTYLLDHSIVLQPNVPSFFQILGSLKQKIDEFMNKQPDNGMLIQQSRNFLVERETRLVNLRRNALDKNSISSSSTEASRESFQRNSPKRRSLTSSFTSIFTKRSSQADISLQTQLQRDEDNLLVYPKFNEAQHVAVCAVLLDEWLKELAALAQEHTISH